MAVEDPNEELYSVLYRAMTDALWNVVGTMVATVVLVIVFLVGLSALFATITGNDPTVFGLVFGTALVGFSVFSFAGLFDLFP